jgi:hypothetical protein
VSFWVTSYCRNGVHICFRDVSALRHNYSQCLVSYLDIGHFWRRGCSLLDSNMDSPECWLLFAPEFSINATSQTNFKHTMTKQLQTIQTSSIDAVWGIPPHLILGCRWYALLLALFVNTQLALCGALWCYWLAVGCDGRATVVKVGWRRYCLEDCWECCSSLGLARWGVLFSEARWNQRVDLAGSH